MAIATAPSVSPWQAAVSVAEDPELAQLLSERMPAADAPRAISVTDLVAPRRAFWRALAPVAFRPERQRRLDLGRAVHRRLGDALAPEGALEVRIRRDGVVGRIDLLSDVPVEVKSSSSAAPPAELLDARPDHVEQLAMYCALADRPVGRLVTLVVGAEASGRVQAVDLSFSDLDGVRGAMRRRGDALRRAWNDRRPHALEACRWSGRGCEFQDAAVCDCSGQDPVTEPEILAAVSTVTERSDIAERIETRLRAVPVSEEAATVRRFRDLLYPRRAYFERLSERPADPPVARDPAAPADLYARLVDAVETGPIGEVARLPSATQEPDEEVGGFRGAPYLVRTSRARDRATPASLIERQPQYALELGYRCVATGAGSARLILGRERADHDVDRVQVFEFRFAPATVFSRLWRDRARQLSDALRERSPHELSACPDWAVADCPYRSECACGDSAPRAQR